MTMLKLGSNSSGVTCPSRGCRVVDNRAHTSRRWRRLAPMWAATRICPVAAIRVRALMATWPLRVSAIRGPLFARHFGDMSTSRVRAGRLPVTSI